MEQTRYLFREAVFVPEKNQLILDGETVVLEQKVSDLLHAFCRRPGQVLTKNWLLEEIWPGRVVNEDSLSVAVSKLRRTLNDNRNQPTFIKTLTGTGYVWLPPVEARQRSARQPQSFATRSPSRRLWLGGVAAILSVAVAGLAFHWSKADPAETTLSLPADLAAIHADAQSKSQSGEEAAVREAVAGFRRIIDEQPGFIDAYLGVAEAKLNLSASRDFSDLSLYAEEAHALLDHVLSQEPENARAWLRKAEVSLLADWQPEAAEAAYRNAIRFAPSDPENHLAYSEFLLMQGRFDESEQVLTELRNLNPSYYRYINMSFVYLMRGELEQALAETRRLLNSEANAASYHRMSHRIGLLLDDPELAFGSLSVLLREQEALAASLDEYEALYRREGIEALFQRFLDEKLQANIGHYRPPIAWARYALVAGDEEAALKWLGRAIDERQPQALLMRVDPHYLPLRNHPGFQSLLERLPL
ncbi:tetratricopeptide repeat protein [Proteobacteria bacterium 005FR1]|nr:tetratricopeptide repeat protein [Proteobacteria bacterium 005FR1]